MNVSHSRKLLLILVVFTSTTIVSFGVYIYINTMDRLSEMAAYKKITYTRHGHILDFNSKTEIRSSNKKNISVLPVQNAFGNHNNKNISALPVPTEIRNLNNKNISAFPDPNEIRNSKFSVPTEIRNSNNINISAFPDPNEIRNSNNINISALPVPGAFSASQFYGNHTLMKYQWYFKPNTNKIFPLNYRFLKTPAPTECTRGSTPLLVIMVITLHNMTSQRQAIRDTWGSVSISNLGKSSSGGDQLLPIKVFFVLGVSKNATGNVALAKEADAKKDIIVAEFDDSYFNLTLKVLMSFRWIREFCPAAKYVMKVDEDTYVNVPKLVALIGSRNWNNTIFGLFISNEDVGRTGKYNISKTAYPPSIFPPHVKGNAYFMPIDVAMKILAVSEYMPYVNIEDTAITGILAKLFNFRHIGFTRDQYYVYTPASPCELVVGSQIVSQQIYHKTFYQIWDRVKDNSLC
ncbi:beta-1,3-galactosyltransferase 1-like [Gigantopelta aegis]|uniref:beta-1,3-galactosyltransferase 1-like n=1 Tax=Gigantopelta aegis TaxID=1735272 RepID=UPI001B88D7E5|nr:beta-1,3-galactosyltransferase 1-like [Gigantopelta aegis]XP_041363247.1 beta-1,3-galactosyltransferase 1-like [Gigantopelta aegis]